MPEMEDQINDYPTSGKETMQVPFDPHYEANPYSRERAIELLSGTGLVSMMDANTRDMLQMADDVEKYIRTGVIPNG